MSRSRSPLLATVVFGLCFVALPSAAAHTVAGLHIDYDDLESNLQAELNEELTDVFARSHRYQWLSIEEGIDTVDGDLQGCFDEDCLKTIGDELNARVGLRIEFDVEDHFYDWTVSFFDLLSGEEVSQELGTCELCGRAEVVEQFRATVGVHLGILDIADEHEEPIEPEVQIDDDHTEVRITVAPEDTRIFVDDTPVGEGTATLELEKGSYDVRFSHDTHHGLRETLVITDDSAPLFVLRIHLREGSEMERQAVVREGGMVQRLGSKRKPIGWSAIGTGAALAVTSVVLADRHGQPNCPPDVALQQCPEVYDTASTASLTAIIGAVALTGGTTLLLWPSLAGDFGDPPDDTSDDAGDDTDVEAHLEVAPAVGRSFSGLTLRGRF